MPNFIPTIEKEYEWEILILELNHLDQNLGYQ